MELCKGGDLFDRLEKKEKFSEREAACIMKQLMVAVKYCHNLGIMHRDIKLDNLLIMDESPDSLNIRLADFGMGELFTPGETFTRKLGSAYYIAPEILQKPCYNQQIDVWSCGVVLYILLSGEPPFWGPTDETIWQSIICDDLVFPEDPWNQISSSAKNLISEMMCRDPDMRMTPDEVLAHSWILKHTAPSPANGSLPVKYSKQKQLIVNRAGTNRISGRQQQQPRLKAM